MFNPEQQMTRQQPVSEEMVKGLFSFLEKENEKRKIHNKSRSKDKLELTNEVGCNITISHKTYLQLVSAYLQTNKAIPHLENPNQAIIKNASAINIKTLQSYVKITDLITDYPYEVIVEGNLYQKPVSWFFHQFDALLSSRFDRDFLTLAVSCNNPTDIISNSTPYSNIYIDNIEYVTEVILGSELDRNRIDIRKIIPQTYQRYMSLSSVRK